MARRLTKKELNALTSELKKLNANWKAIYLFGSTAKGTATAHSDRDFCVVMPTGSKDLDRLWVKLNGQLGYKGFHFDIVVTDEKEFLKNMISPILHEIRTTGVRVA